MTEQTSSKVPQIRFKGFDEKWEEKALGEITTYKNGKGHEDRQSSYGKYELINLNSISISGGLKNSGKFIDEADETLKVDDLVMILSDVAHGNLLGRVARIPENDRFVLNQRVALLRPWVSKSSTYLLYQINARQSYFKLRGAGMSQLNISKNVVTEFTLFTPAEDEQTQIGEYFRELDSLIGLHQRKHDKLVTLKKAMLQKMFPQPGATTPEIRFKGFSSPWDSIEMEKLGQTYSGLFGKSKDDFGRGDGRFVTYMGVFNHTVSNLNVTDAIGVDPSQNEVRKGDVLFTISSETPHEVGMSSVWLEDTKNVYLNSFCFGFRPLPSLKSDFLAYVFRADAFRKKICVLAQGISRYNISKTKVMKIPVSIPDPAEQQKIGTYFRTLDALISQHATQLQKLQQIKSACLERMFV